MVENKNKAQNFQKTTTKTTTKIATIFNQQAATATKKSQTVKNRLLPLLRYKNKHTHILMYINI